MTPDRQWTKACTLNTGEPETYMQWHHWADEMSKTHTQQRCLKCRLFHVWVPKRGTRATRGPKR